MRLAPKQPRRRQLAFRTAADHWSGKLVSGFGGEDGEEGDDELQRALIASMHEAAAVSASQQHQESACTAGALCLRGPATAGLAGTGPAAPLHTDVPRMPQAEQCLAAAGEDGAYGIGGAAKGGRGGEDWGQAAAVRGGGSGAAGGVGLSEADVVYLWESLASRSKGHITAGSLARVLDRMSQVTDQTSLLLSVVLRV
jgi:hypothetical protein